MEIGRDRQDEGDTDDRPERVITAEATDPRYHHALHKTVKHQRAKNSIKTPFER